MYSQVRVRAGTKVSKDDSRTEAAYSNPKDVGADIPLTKMNPCAIAVNCALREFDEEKARVHHQDSREQHRNERDFPLLVEARKIRLTIIALKKVFFKTSMHEVLCVAFIALASG